VCQSLTNDIYGIGNRCTDNPKAERSRIAQNPMSCIRTKRYASPTKTPSTARTINTDRNSGMLAHVIDVVMIE
jgi:hypothetical protein